jgi:lysozyme family protein
MKLQHDAAFMAVIDFVLDSEGGYADDPNDEGGPTMRGIAWNFNAGWLIANGYTLATLKSLTKYDAMRCYYERYWLESGAHGLTDPDLAYLHLDSAVQHGAGKARSWLNSLPKNPKHFDFSDGKNKALAIILWQKYLAKRMRYYAVLRTWPHHGRGWMNRCADVLDNAAELD